MQTQKARIHQSSMFPFEDFNRGVTPETLDEFRAFVRETLRAPGLIYEQKRDALAAAAMRALPYPPVSGEAEQLIAAGVIDLIAEGAAPFHPRYVAPDFGRLLREGSAFLELPPAEDLHQAAASLLAAYHYIPCGGLPVFIGRIDELLEPFVAAMPEEAARAVLRSFWLLVDRLNPSAFVHANIGPQATKTGRLLLELDRELKTITNLSLRYDPSITPDDFALLAVRNQLALTKPYFVNHPLMLTGWGEDYVIASCYNTMRLGGGIFTLVRLNLKEAAALSGGSPADFLSRVIPDLAARQVEVINSRARCIVEDAGWLEQNFWIGEGYLDPAKFTSYAGVFGLAEAVNGLMAAQGRPDARYGSSEEANALAAQIVARLGEELAKHPAAYCEGWGGRVLYHAQVGISSDVDVTPGVRVPSGEEPGLIEHLLCEAPHHACIAGGVSTILEFDQTAAQNPAAVLDILKGAMQSGLRLVSVGSADSEFIRVTGYLVRRSDLENARNEKALRHSSAALGAEFFQTKPNHLHRRTRQV
jgi:YjjI family glycine radical enzyme